MGLITKRLKETFKAPDEALFFVTLKFPPRMPFLSLCGNNQGFFFRGEVGFPAFYDFSKDHSLSGSGVQSKIRFEST